MLKNIHIVDIKRAQINENHNITFHDGKIAEIYPGDESSGNRRTSKEFWAIPSLIDMHAHLSFEGREHLGVKFKYDEEKEYSFFRASQNLIEALLSGVCLMRDVGNKDCRLEKIKQLLDDNFILGPEVVFSGEPLCIENGHGFEFGQTLSTQSVEELLDLHLKNGYEWLKIMNGPELFDNYVLQKTVDKAHERGIKIAIHAFTEPGIESAIKVGADTIEHAVAYNEQIAKIAKKNKIMFVPTFYSAYTSLSKDYLSTITDQISVDYLHQWYNFLNKYFSFHLSAGLPILAGTDAGAAPCTFSEIVKEIKYLKCRGMLIIDALRSATLLAAETLGKDDLFGSIETGKWGNIILLSSNPLDNINALDRMSAIWFKGKKILDRDYSS